MKQYDIIVVGTGGATIVADAAQKKGLNVAIIEKGKFGAWRCYGFTLCR